ncbi:MAG TPA: DUF6311 domain-containing protein [Rhodopila sp.]|nr:DUF6311 domain-containing protein [Rhodopila sp.]
MKPLVSVARFLERDRSPPWLAICGIAIAAGYACATFGLAFLLGTGPFWANPRGPWLMDPNDSLDSVDVLVMRVAYQAFVRTPWGLPLFYVPGLGAPAGTSVALLDVLPLIALPGKALAWATGLALNPYGIWVAACFILAALFAVLLLIALGQRSLLAAFAASLLAITMPALLYRFGHISLLGQFILIAALWRYVRDLQPDAARRRPLWWAGLLTVAALIHPYLLAMTGAIYAAAVLRRHQAEHPRGAGMWRELVAVAGCVAVVLLACGYFGKGSGTSASAGGFGYFSMNLLSPVWPQRSGLFPGFHDLLTGRAGQYEGFNYLGAGVLLLLAMAVAASWRSLPGLLRRHLILLVAFIYLTLFAVSNIVYGGTRLLLYVPLPEAVQFLAGIFRASGRMFWPCGYAIALFSLALVLRHLPPGWKSAVVLGCCMVQVIDSNPLRVRITQITHRQAPLQIDHAAWAARMRQADRIEVTPPFACGRLNMDAVQLELQQLAVTTGRPINTVYNSRLQTDCAASVQAAMRGPWDAHTLYVFLQADGIASTPPEWRPAGLACAPFGHGVWCLGSHTSGPMY